MLFFTAAAPCSIPINRVHQGSNFFTSFLTLVIFFFLFDSGHSNGCEVASFFFSRFETFSNISLDLEPVLYPWL